MDRRSFLGGIAAASLYSTLPEAATALGVNSVRALKLYNVHNDEVVYAAFWRNGNYDLDGLAQLDRFFRDWRNNKIKRMNPEVYTILYALQEGLSASSQGIHLISGYRSPETNALLRKRSSRVAKNSLHLQGRASDIRVPGVGLKQLHGAAKSLKKGGVGYYGRSEFVHVDNGPIRYW